MLVDLMAPGPRIGEGPEPIQPMRRAIPADLTPSPTRRLPLPLFDPPDFCHRFAVVIKNPGEFAAQIAEPAEIIQQLNLLRPIYSKTTNYGHFGKDDPEITWDKTDKVAALKRAAR